MGRGFVFALVLAVACGCGARVSEEGRGTGGNSTTSDGSVASIAASTGASQAGASGSGGAAAGGGEPGPVAYAASNTNGPGPLLTLTPMIFAIYEPLRWVQIGTTACPGYFSAADIARDVDGRLFMTSTEQLFVVDLTTLACTPIGSGGLYTESLAILPAGVLDATDTALVGVRHKDYVRIDKQTGAITILGKLDEWVTSTGDIAFFESALYVTVFGGTCGDCLARMDPVTGAVQEVLGPIGTGSVDGLAAWNGNLYGFDSFTGRILRLNTQTGAATFLTIATLVGFTGATSL